MPDRAGSRVFLGVPAEACGLRRSDSQPVPGHIPLSPGHSSLRPRSLELARSPQKPQSSPIQINWLRADESSSWIAALAARGDTCSPQRAIALAVCQNLAYIFVHEHDDQDRRADSPAHRGDADRGALHPDSIPGVRQACVRPRSPKASRVIAWLQLDWAWATSSWLVDTCRHDSS